MSYKPDGKRHQPQPAHAHLWKHMKSVLSYPLSQSGFLGFLKFPFPPQMHLVWLSPQYWVNRGLLGMFLWFPPGSFFTIPFPFRSVCHFFVVSVHFLFLQQWAWEIWCVFESWSALLLVRQRDTKHKQTLYLRPFSALYLSCLQHWRVDHFVTDKIIRKELK